jgi:hypothetical protein
MGKMAGSEREMGKTLGSRQNGEFRINGKIALHSLLTNRVFTSDATK